jgi:hypothetical protein
MDNRIPAAEILRGVANQEETKLEAINAFKEGSNEYGPTNTEVISSTNGTKIDIQQRAALGVINFYSENNPYKTPE